MVAKWLPFNGSAPEWPLYVDTLALLRVLDTLVGWLIIILSLQSSKEPGKRGNMTLVLQTENLGNLGEIWNIFKKSWKTQEKFFRSQIL